MRRARRRASDQLDRKGGFFVHRFEKILSWTEFMNLHRNVEDDEEDAARKAADDHDEIGIGRLERKAATRLAIDLDLAPADMDAERLSDALTYREWDFRRQTNLPDHVRVLERASGITAAGAAWQPDPKAQQRIRAVRRQFEALRPRRELLARQLDGHELDMDELIRSLADLQAFGEGSDRIYQQAREEARDLSVAVLVDVSRSTERLLIVLTDGKPNDLDHYEGRYGVEDTRKAILEARQAGLAVFGITIDSKAHGYISHIFGAGGFAILSHPGRLTAALPKLYRQLVA
jgi:nitric oxide reductase NorD protein